MKNKRTLFSVMAASAFLVGCVPEYYTLDTYGGYDDYDYPSYSYFDGEDYYPGFYYGGYYGGGFHHRDGGFGHSYARHGGASQGTVVRRRHH